VGTLGRWHAEIVRRTAALAMTVLPRTGAVLDVGCGSGALVRALEKDADGLTFVGVDPAAQMLTVATRQPTSARAAFALAYAEALPWRSDSFDAVVTSVSFGHWSDQQAGLSECRRVLVAGGPLVVVDIFARWLNIATRRGTMGSAHSRSRTAALLDANGFQAIEWHDIYGHVIGAAVAR
jgi:ubiquinone/menaquinone biosynthesis C-methylase UbiE